MSTAHVSHLKVPPHSLDAEHAVLGALMVDDGASSGVFQAVAVDDFYRREHRLIFAAMLEQVAAGKPIDALTISHVLANTDKLKEAGGTEYLAELVSASPGSSNIVAYAKIIQERALERSLISAAHHIADSGYNPDGRTITERLESAQALLGGIQAPEGRSAAKSLGSLLKDAIYALEQQHDRKGQLLGMSTGFTALDARTQGMRPDQLIIIAGRPGMGKSALAQNIAEHVAQQKKLAIVFSLEMPGIEIANRSLSSQGRVPAAHLTSGSIKEDEWDKLSSGLAKMYRCPLYVDDDATITSAQIASRTKEIARKAGLEVSLLVVDYLQLFADKGDGVSRVTQISRNLKLAAKMLHCTVIALSQLNRGVESRGDKRPMMSDLRESGAIEADADVIWMLYRDEVYNENSEDKGIAEVITRKLRAGQIGTDRLAANLNLYRFDNLHPGRA